MVDPIERQIRRWEILQRAAQPAAPAPCVALSRLPGSGGAELGECVANKLDYGFFGIEIVDQIARQRGIQRHLVEDLDEHVRSVIDRYVTDAFKTNGFTESDYVRAVVRTIHTLAERGSVVLLGRGAPFVLGPERALRVLVVAPREARVERLAADRRIARGEAEALVERLDADRRAFHARDFGVDGDDPSLYELVVNTGTLGMDTASALVVDAFHRRFPR